MKPFKTRPKLQKSLGGNCTDSLTQMHPRAGFFWPLPENVILPEQVVGDTGGAATEGGNGGGKRAGVGFVIWGKLFTLPGLRCPSL